MATKRQVLVFFHPLSLGLLLLLYACNGRPTYDVLVTELRTDCGGLKRLSFEHDPDPEYKTIKFEPGFEEIAERENIRIFTEGNGVVVEIGPEITCSHSYGLGLGKCLNKTTHATPQCVSHMKLLAYRWPTLGPGSGPVFGKKGEDTPPEVPLDNFDFDKYLNDTYGPSAQDPNREIAVKAGLWVR